MHLLETRATRATLASRGRFLTLVTLSYNSLEGLIALTAGVMAGSIALVGFGADSIIEVMAAGAVLWRLAADADLTRRVRAERLSLRIVGACFLALAAYITVDALLTLRLRRAPERSTVGIVLAVTSLIVMPVLARAKRRVAVGLASRALTAEAQQTQLCAYLSAILVVGLLLNATIGWWWADPVAALAMAPIIAREGVAALRGEATCADGCCG